jgi:hypothetical protein
MPSIDAHVTKVELDEATAWYRITTDHERVKRLDTKRPDNAREAVALMKSGDLARIEFTEMESKNVNQFTGKPYMNRYWEHGGSIDDKPEIEGVETIKAQSRSTNPIDAWRISLAAGGKLAVATLPMMPVEQRSFEVQKQIAIAWATFFFFTPPPDAPETNGGSSSQFQSPVGAGATRNPGAYDDPTESEPPRSDDDIPF